MDGPLQKWMFGHAVLMLSAAIVSVVLQAVLPVIVTMCGSLLVLFAGQYRNWSAILPWGGYANHVTFTRWILLLCALMLSRDLAAHWFVGMVLVVIIADGLDGYLARRFGTETPFGEVFDTEVDAFLALTLSLIITLDYPAAVWVVTGGLLRYGFILAYRVLGWHGRRRPYMPETKTFAVLYFFTLLTPWLVAWEQAQWIVLAGTLLIVYSFLREFVLMARVTQNRGGQ